MKIKGVYRWQLIDTKTGHVDREGQQENLVTDTVLVAMLAQRGFYKTGVYGQIILSTQSVPLPVAEYREYGAAVSAPISRDYLSGNLTYVYDDPAGIRKCSYNFVPPGSPQTFTIFACDHVGLSYGTYQFQSFIVLTTPVTQSTSQFLFVEYSMVLQYTGGLLNSPNNAFVNDYINGDVYNRIGYIIYRTAISEAWACITPFRAPATINNVARKCLILDTITHSSAPNNGCRYGQDPTESYTSTQYPGPIGCPIWMRYTESGVFPNALLGTFDTNLAPSISRVYVHPDAYKAQVFSDPSNPPSSRGATVISGTSTCKVPIVMRVQITKTGDASDIVDETFTADFTTDKLTVSHDDWADNDIVQVSSTVALPSPLLAAIDYYIVNKSGTSPTVLIELSLTEGGATINLTDNGTGTHTISRQNTGRYRLTMEPCLSSLSSNEVVKYIENRNIIAGVDAAGVSLPNQYSLITTGQVVIGREGEYLYTVQYSADEDQLNICKHYLYSVETSESLHSLFGTSGVIMWCAVRGKGTYSDIVYIATSDGIYKYDLASPATPTLIVISGMLATAVTELTFDEITEYLWAGHTQGMSRINLGTNVATQYDNGVSDPLEGIPTANINCHPGSLTAHNGYVLYARVRDTRLWLLLDGTGYSQITTLGLAWGATINKSDGTIVARTYTSARWATYNVTGITAINTGTWNIVENFDTGYAQNDERTTGQMLQISDTKFLQYTVYYSSGLKVRAELYEVGIGVSNVNPATGVDFIGETATPHLKIANTRVGIDISENDMGLFINMFDTNLLHFTGILDFGWTGSAWSKNNTSDRQITKTSTDSLSHGLTVQFNNSVGDDWDVQFVLNEHFTFMIAPVLIKDNLQEYTVKVRSYYTTAKRVVEWATTIAANVTVPEAPTGSLPDPNFRDLETLDWVIEVYNVTTASSMTQVASPPGDGQYSVVGLLDGTFEFHANQIGDSVKITYNYTCYG